MENGDPRVVNIDLAFFPPFGSVSFPAIEDNLDEGRECLVVVLSVNETELDPRDQGQVDFVNSVALIRIEDTASKIIDNVCHIIFYLTLFLLQ